MANKVSLAGNLLLAALFQTAAQGQLGVTRNVVEGTTPPGIAGATPANSYALSGLDRVNPFNGSLSFTLPLYHVGGRGEAGYTITLNIAHRWSVDTQMFCAGAGTCTDPTLAGHSMDPVSANLIQVGYGAGLMLGRTGMEVVASTVVSPECPAGTAIENSRLTRFTWMSPDGSEIEFRDAVSDGAPFSRTGTAAGACTIVAAPSSRGRVFYARDGSGATYVLDQPFTENGLGKYVFSNVIGTMGPNGNLMFPNGVLYRINNGLVEWIRDRNGNVTRFTLATTPDRRVVGITDPLGRYVEICYSGNGCGLADPTPEPSKIYDRILYYGAQGARQEIRVYKDSLENLLCTGALPACPGAGAGKAVAVDTLFPLAERGGLALPTPLNYHNPSDVTAGVKLANGKMYQFTYNGYQELARVTLPTGGAVEYDWGPGQYVGCAFGCASPSGFFGGVRGIVLRGVIERREKDKNGSLTLKRQFQWSNASERKVVSTDGGTGAVLKEEVHLFFGHPLTAGSMESWGYAGWMEGKEYQTDWFNGSTLIRRSLQTWEQRAPVTWWTGSGQTAVNAPSNDPRVTRTDTLSVGLSRVDSTTKGRWIRQSIGYGDSSNRYNNVVDVEDTDYGNEVVAYTTPSPSATVLRKMHFDYKVDEAYTSSVFLASPGNGIFKTFLPSLKSFEYVCGNVSVPCGAANALAKTEYRYDVANASITQYSDITGHTSSPGSTLSPWGPAEVGRGNVTKVLRWRNLPAETWLETKSDYDMAGNVIIAQNANSQATIFTHADTPCSGNLSPPSGTYAFATSILMPLGHTVARKFDYYLGKPCEFLDPNNTSYTYPLYDAIGRLTAATADANGSSAKQKTSLTYNDDAPSVTVKADQINADDGLRQSTSVYNGFGRLIQSKVTTTGADVLIETKYDGLGRVRQVSNPCETAGCTLFTTTGYDALDRVVSVTRPDGTTVSTVYGNDSERTTDGDGRVKEIVRDGLGRMVSVTEGLGNPEATTTSYSYDALGNLTTVTQPGVSQRSFTYNSLSQLISANNPESGVTTYEYDNNGNVKKITNGVVTDITYDALDRMATKTIADVASSQVVQYCYDGATYDPSSGNCTGGPVTGKKMRLTGVGNRLSTGTQISWTSYDAFDGLGRVTQSSQMTAGMVQAAVMNYSYNRDGTLSTLQYPSRRVVKNCYDRAGRVKWVKLGEGDCTGATPPADPPLQKYYATDMSYHAHGTLKQMKYGNGLWETVDVNPARLWPTTMKLGATQGGSSVWQLSNGQYSGEGDVKQQTLTIPGANPINTVYQYDALHRLTVAAENAVNPIAPDCGQPNSWCEKYNYGAGGVGNRAMPEKTGVGSGYSVLGRPTSFTVQNRMAPEAANYQSPGWIYDGRGNVTRNLGNGTFAYDGENRMRAHCRLDTNPDPNPANCTATAGAGRTIYWYDGEGRRVKREEPSGAVTTYVYDAFGQLSAEYSTGAAVTVGRRFLTVDHLGSTRVVTDEGSAATVVERRDYFPFGEEIPSTQGSVRAGVAGYVSSERLGFTGKERDAETGLDYFGARYMSSAQGRFTSPDAPFNDQHPEDPQSWNLYSYTRNNPLAHVDVNGEFVATVTGALAGGLIGGAVEAYRGGSFWKGAASGAVSGAIAGSIIDTGGASLGVLALAGAAGGVGGGVVGRALEGQGTSVGDVARDASVGAVAGAVGGKLGEVVVNKVAGMVVQRAANAAVDAVGPGSGAAYGTRVHSAMEGALNKSGVAKALNLNTEVSYSGGQVVSRGTPGSVRVDVVRGNPSNPGAAFDLKTGTAKLTPGRTQQIQQAMPRPVPVKEIRPEVP